MFLDLFLSSLLPLPTSDFMQMPLPLVVSKDYVRDPTMPAQMDFQSQPLKHHQATPAQETILK